MTHGKLKILLEEWVNEGKEFHEISKALEPFQLDAEKTKWALSQADDLIVQRELQSEVRQKFVLRMILGATLVCVGFLAFFFAVRAGNNYIYGAIITVVGAYFFRKSYAQYHAPIGKIPVTKKPKNIFDRY